MITSPDNSILKLIRKLQRKRERAETGLFVAEGEDLIEAAAAAGWAPVHLLVSGEDVEPELLDRVSSLGSGTRVLAVYRQRWAEPGGKLSVYLHGVGDPGNVGTIIRTAHALCDGPVTLGPACADPFSPKAVRAAMGSLFARPPARVAAASELPGTVLALDPHAELALGDVAAVVRVPVVVAVGAEREGLPPELIAAAGARARIALHEDGPDSLNVAAAAAIALHELGNRMPPDA